MGKPPPEGMSPELRDYFTRKGIHESAKVTESITASGPIVEDRHMDGMLVCPVCKGDNVHIDRVDIGAARVDLRPSVEGKTFAPAQVRHPTEVAAQRVTLIGWCELCCTGFGYSFGQHKGNTFVTAHIWQHEECNQT